MILGMSVSAFTQLHVIISLIGIGAGALVAYGFITGRSLPTWTALFLITTVLTSVTGFMFPFKAIGPPHIFGVISLVALALGIFALYVRRLTGSWRRMYIATALLSLYLNVVVAVVQAFQKIPSLNVLAPTGSEPPVAITQLAVLALFILLGFRSFRRFRPPTMAVAQ